MGSEIQIKTYKNYSSILYHATSQKNYFPGGIKFLKNVGLHERSQTFYFCLLESITPPQHFPEDFTQNGSNPIGPLGGPEGPHWWNLRIQPSAGARKGPQSGLLFSYFIISSPCKVNPCLGQFWVTVKRIHRPHQCQPVTSCCCHRAHWYEVVVGSSYYCTATCQWWDTQGNTEASCSFPVSCSPGRRGEEPPGGKGGNQGLLTKQGWYCWLLPSDRGHHSEDDGTLTMIVSGARH